MVVCLSMVYVCVCVCVIKVQLSYVMLIVNRIDIKLR